MIISIENEKACDKMQHAFLTNLFYNRDQWILLNVIKCIDLNPVHYSQYILTLF